MHFVLELGSLKISFYLYDNELNLFNENDIKKEFKNAISIFYPSGVYEIMEKYGVYNKNFILLFTVINIIHTSKVYFNEELSNYNRLNFRLSLVDKKDIDLVEKYYEIFMSMIE